MIRAYRQVCLAAADRSMRQHYYYLGGEAPGELSHRTHDALVTGLSMAQLFNVDNIVEWLMAMEMTSNEAFEMMSQLPSCTPPYPITYLEWDNDGVASSAVAMHVEFGDRKGVMIDVFDTNEGRCFHLGSLQVRFDDQGRVVTMDGHPTVPRIVVYFDPTLEDGLRREPELDGQVRHAMAAAVGITLFTFSLLHCTNVRAVDVDPRASMSRQQLREAGRKKREILVHKVLEVRPLHRYRRSEDETEGEGRKKRLHHVRGHFVEYGPAYGKGKLFGRLEGRFWVPPHARGTMQEGVVSKTYALAKPGKPLESGAARRAWLRQGATA